MESQLRDQLNRMQPIVEAAQELLEALQPWLQGPMHFNPFGSTPTYPTWKLDKPSFDALGKLLLAFRFAEPDAYVLPPPSDSTVLSRIYTLLQHRWPDYDTIEGPFIIQWPTDPAPADMPRTWLAHVYRETNDTWIGVRGWVGSDGVPIISHTATFRPRRKRAS